MVRHFGRRLAGVATFAFGVLFTAGAILAEPRPAADFASIHDIMKKGHGKKGLLNQIKDGVKTEKWDDVAKPAAELKKFGADLGLNTPDKGEDDSWKKLTGEYQAVTTAIAAGIEKKDAKATNEALTKMGKSCKACHDGHK